MRRMILSVAAITVWSLAGTALGQSAAFTYQGQLKDGGVPFTDTADFQFTLWDAAGNGNPPVGGAQLGGVEAVNALPVNAGLFTTTLNASGAFGANAFNGNARWLQIAVRSPAGAGAFTTLAPRQPLTATPYALFALSSPGSVGGSGTISSIPFWSSATTLGNSQITQNANGVQLPNGVQLAVGAQGNGLSFGSPNGETGLTIAGPTGRADLRFGTFNSAETKLKLVVRAAGGSGPPAETNGIAITTAGNVGIGTASPVSKLDIAATGEGAELLRFSTERPWVFRQVRTGPSASLQLLSTVGQKRFEITAVEGNNVATFFADGANSRVGIGTVDPVAKLDVYGGSGNAVVGTHNGGGDTAGVFGYSPMPGGNGIIGQADVGNASYGVWGRSFSGIGGFFSGGTYALVADGRAKVDILEIAGADVAEKFLSIDENIEPGTVMEIDSQRPGQIRIAREAYSSRVAGVVSGAGDIPVGAVLGNLPGHEDAPPIALSGRVWVRCDATKASITPGDLLTTSDTPGQAMKASDRERSHGAVLGKAMSALEQGEHGLVLVLVNLQ